MRAPESGSDVSGRARPDRGGAHITGQGHSACRAAGALPAACTSHVGTGGLGVSKGHRTWLAEGAALYTLSGQPLQPICPDSKATKASAVPPARDPCSRLPQPRARGAEVALCHRCLASAWGLGGTRVSVALAR